MSKERIFDMGRLAERRAYEEESFAIDDFPDMEGFASTEEWPELDDDVDVAARANDEVPF